MYLINLQLKVCMIMCNDADKTCPKYCDSYCPHNNSTCASGEFNGMRNRQVLSEVFLKENLHRKTNNLRTVKL